MSKYVQKWKVGVEADALIKKYEFMFVIFPTIAIHTDMYNGKVHYIFTVAWLVFMINVELKYKTYDKK